MQEFLRFKHAHCCLHSFHVENGRLFVAFLAIVKSLHLYTWPTVSITIRGGRGIMLDPIQIVLCVTGATDGTFFGQPMSLQPIAFWQPWISNKKVGQP